MKRSELAFTALLIPVDALMLFLAFLAAYYLRNNGFLITSEVIGSFSNELQYSAGAIKPLHDYLRYIWYLVPAMVAIFAWTGLYAVRPPASFGARFLRISMGVSMGLFFILLLFLFKRDFFLPRTMVLYSWVLGILFVTIGRFSVRLIQRGLNRFGIGVIRVAIVGNADIAKLAIEKLEKRSNISYRAEALPTTDSLEDIVGAITRDRFDELVVASDRYSTDDLVMLRNRCLEEHVGFSFVPRAFMALHGAAYEIQEEIGLPVIQVKPTPLDGWGRIYKRGFDLVVGSLLVLICSPLYTLIGIIQCLSLRSTSIMFSQPRVGRGGKTIWISKYRSMKEGWGDKNGTFSPKFVQYLKDNPEAAKEWEENHKLKNDPRVTSFGRFLRATRFDELPQFFDVLRGDLSLVGPRPIFDWEVQDFGEKARILFHVRPGVTGPWQVGGGNNLVYDARVRMSAEYIEHWNLWNDSVIIAKTAWMILKVIGNRLVGRRSSEEGY